MSGVAVTSKPARSAGEAPLFLHELIDAAPQRARVLDAGCGPGSWLYARRADLRITGFDVKFPPGPPPRSANAQVFRGDLARLPLRADTFDLTICHYVLEHVTELGACCDELARVTKPGGTLYLSAPRSAAFDDRLYRFAGYFAKYALLKLGKRIEHQQRFDFQMLLDLFYAREQGYFTEAGISAELTPMAGGAEILPALIGGSLDIGTLNSVSFRCRRVRNVSWSKNGVSTRPGQTTPTDTP